MGLLNPFNLIYLLSLGALILIYLRARSRPTIEVSSLMLFDEVPAPVANVRWLRVDLLFWLEMLALSALSLAAAGLYLKAPAAPERAGRHALVFDLGAAMGASEAAGSRLDQAKREALAIVAAAPAGDQFSVIGYSLDPGVVRALSANRESLRESIAALKALAVPARPAALSAALMRAREADTIDLFADRLPLGDALGALGARSRLRFHQVGSAAENLAVVSLDPGSVRVSPGHCVVRNFSPRPRLCELAIDCSGERVLRSTVILEPQSQLVVPFGPLTSGGVLSARILSPDALAADNQRWAYAPSDTPDQVLVVSPDVAARDDLARVLLAVDQDFIITALDAKKFKSGQEPHDLRLAVMHDFYEPRVRAPSRLLVYPPASAEFAVSATVAAGELRERVGQGIFAQPPMLGAARVLAMPSWMEVLATGTVAGSAGSIPMAASGRDRQGTVGVLAFDVRNHLLLDPDRLDALILAVDLVKQLVAPQDLQIVATGAYVTVPAVGSARIIAPDGADQTVSADSSGRIRFRALQAGRYRVVTTDRTASVFANYFDAAESDLAAKPPERLNPKTSTSAENGVALGATQVRPLDLALVALALIAFLAESTIIIRNAARWGWRHV